MKKSEHLYHAMLAVLNSRFSEDVRLEVLEMLMDQRKTALFVEEREEAEKEDHA